MACEFLVDGRRVQCLAVEGTVIPSHHERERYCRRDDPSACPTLRLYRIRGKPVPQEDYWALWLPEEEPATL